MENLSKKQGLVAMPPKGQKQVTVIQHNALASLVRFDLELRIKPNQQHHPVLGLRGTTSQKEKRNIASAISNRSCTRPKMK